MKWACFYLNQKKFCTHKSAFYFTNICLRFKDLKWNRKNGRGKTQSTLHLNIFRRQTKDSISSPCSSCLQPNAHAQWALNEQIKSIPNHIPIAVTCFPSHRAVYHSCFARKICKLHRGKPHQSYPQFYSQNLALINHIFLAQICSENNCKIS